MVSPIKCTKNVPIFVLICLMFLNVVLKIVSSLFNGAVPKKSTFLKTKPLTILASKTSDLSHFLMSKANSSLALFLNV